MVGQQLELGQEDAEPGGQFLGLQGPTGRRHVARRGRPAARAGPGTRRACRPAPWTPGAGGLGDGQGPRVVGRDGLHGEQQAGDEQEGDQGPGVAGREDLHDEQQADDEQEGARDLLVSSCPKDRVSVNMIF